MPPMPRARPRCAWMPPRHRGPLPRQCRRRSPDRAEECRRALRPVRPIGPTRQRGALEGRNPEGPRQSAAHGRSTDRCLQGPNNSAPQGAPNTSLGCIKRGCACGSTQAVHRARLSTRLGAIKTSIGGSTRSSPKSRAKVARTYASKLALRVSEPGSYRTSAPLVFFVWKPDRGISGRPQSASSRKNASSTNAR